MSAGHVDRPLDSSFKYRTLPPILYLYINSSNSSRFLYILYLHEQHMRRVSKIPIIHYCIHILFSRSWVLIFCAPSPQPDLAISFSLSILNNRYDVDSSVGTLG